jgi:hypothetical protein
MSAGMFCEVTNVTAESDPGKKRRRITRKKIGLDAMSNVPHALIFKSFPELLEVDLHRRDIALICVV